MKSPGSHIVRKGHASPPARGAWIEIVAAACLRLSATVSPPARGAWIEIFPGELTRACV